MAETKHHGGSFAPVYRSREEDAAAIGGFFTGAANRVKDTASTAIASAVNPVVAEGRAMLDSVVTSIKAVAPTAIATATAALAKLQYSGTTGNFQSATEDIVLTLTAYDVAEDNSAHIGAPYRKTVPLWLIGGFCQCENAKLELSCTYAEQKAVEELLNKGVYLE